MQINQYVDMIKNNNYKYTLPDRQQRTIIHTDEKVQDFEKQIDSVKQNVRKLKTTKADSYVQTKLEKQLSKFKESYNSLKKKYTDVSEHKDLSKQLEKLDKLISDNEKELKKIGIKFDKKGLLEFDSEKLDDVKGKTIEGLFEGTGSFFYKANNILSKIEKTAEKAEKTFTRESYMKSILFSEEDFKTANECSAMYLLTEILGTEDTIVQAINQGIITGDEKEEYLGNVHWDMDDFCMCFRQLCEKGPNEFKEIMNLNRENKNNFNKIGIKVDDVGKIYLADSEIQSIDKFAEGYHQIFGEDSTYKEKLMQASKKLLDKSLKVDKTGISIELDGNTVGNVVDTSI